MSTPRISSELDAVQEPHTKLPHWLAPGLRAARRNARPFAAIQLSALALLIAYYRLPAVAAACSTVAAWSSSLGLVGAALASAVAGGVLPEVAKLVMPRRDVVRKFGHALYNAGVFALCGVLTNAFYQLQGVLFGQAPDPATLLKKTALDMLVFTPALGLPIPALLFLWRELDFSMASLATELKRGFWRRRVLPLLVPAWAYWTPLVLIIYALPPALQFMLFVFALAAWSLILVFITSSAAPEID